MIDRYRRVRHHLTFWLMGLLVLGQVGFASAAGPIVMASPNGKQPAIHVVIDPGHGGIDGGTTEGSTLEKFIVLDIALKMRDLLRARGDQVTMTRDADTDLSGRYPSDIPSRHRRDLRNRSLAIDEAQADLAVSLHANYSTDRRQKGPIVFYGRESPESMEMAKKVQNALNATFHVQNHALPARYYILRTAKRPIILVEVGFLSHTRECQLLETPQYRMKIAKVLVDAIAQD